MVFEIIKNIDVSVVESWQNKIFLTFDVDWCSDEVLSYTLDILEKYSLKATFFVTHDTSLLRRMEKNSNIELGTHPNFNFLLNGDFRQGKNIDEVVANYLLLVPNAVSVRSHSLTQGGIFTPVFEKYGLKYECNSLISVESGIIRPYRYGGMIVVPHIFEDDAIDWFNNGWGVKNYLDYKGLKVFDFHPIHVFLNTEKMTRYENARGDLHNFDSLKQNVNNTNYGTKNFLIDLIERGLMA